MSPRLQECDLVMKGGITSGVVYPPAILELARTYRFRSIGGASVGAIAAAVTAAAEFGRQMGTGGFAPVRSVSEELTRPGFMVSLFQPKAALRGPFSLLVESTKRSSGRPLRLIWAILRDRPRLSAASILAWLAFLSWSLVTGHVQALATAMIIWTIVLLPVPLLLVRGWRKLLVLALPVLFLLLPPLLPSLLVLTLTSLRALNGPGFGMCTGMPVDGGSLSLTTWLHAKIQTAAGIERPLTFRDLRLAGVDLQVTSTDLSAGRPVVVPRDLSEYYFAEADLRELFPHDVVRYVLAHSVRVRGGPPRVLWRLGSVEDLPVLVAFRLSMSFPVLFTAVRLYGTGPRDADGEVSIVPRWLSDGGIGSNFPIQFFDAWFPGRPTFGLNLGPYPQDAQGRPIEEHVFMPRSPTSEPSPRLSTIGGVVGLARQIVDTMENWRDSMQADLPGFQDRVCEIRLTGDQGGLNLGMQRAAIEELIRKGREAGKVIAGSFSWEQHRFTRFLLLTQMIERGLLGDLDEQGHLRPGARATLTTLLAELERAGCDPGRIYAWERSTEQIAVSVMASEALLALAGSWAPPPKGTGAPFDVFDPISMPGRRCVMRLVPSV